METLEFYLFLVVLLVVLVVCWLITRTVSEYFRAKVAKSRQMAAVRRGNASGTSKNGSKEFGPWVEDLLEQFGYSGEDLYAEEMPEELEELLQNPMVKGFLKSAGSGEEGGGGAPLFY